jgi:uncharacterized protein YcaQ
VPRAVARRLFLDAQGLLDDPTRRCTSPRLYRAVERMGFVQIDSIDTIARAHHLTLGSRFDHYRSPSLTHLLEVTRELFEHWTHDAAAIPTRWFPHWRHRFELQRRRIEASAWWRERLGKDPRALLARVEGRVRDAGPVLAKDFLDPAGAAYRKKSGWWEWRPEKAALEYLWHTGRLAVVRREGFQKVYDLVERVLPDHHALPPPAGDVHVDWAARSALERLGVATPRELAAFWHLLSVTEAAAWCAARAKAGEVVVVRIDGGEVASPAYAPADWERRSRCAPDPPDRIRLLSPFDPIVRDLPPRLGSSASPTVSRPSCRRRGTRARLHVLPMLERDRLVRRIEPRLDRDGRTLRPRPVVGSGLRPTAARRAHSTALERLAALVGAREIRHDGERRSVSRRRARHGERRARRAAGIVT